MIISCPVFYSAVEVERQACFLFEDYFFGGFYLARKWLRNVLASPVTCAISQKSDKSAKELSAGNNL